MDNIQNFVESETQRIYNEYKKQAEIGCENHSDPSTKEAFFDASGSLIGDFVEVTRGIV
jgi:hypothetical protein